MDILFFRKLLLIVTLFLLSFVIGNQTVWAQSLVPTCNVCKNENQWLLGMGGGGVKRNLNSSTRILNGSPVATPYDHDIYTIRTSSYKGIIKLFGGYQWGNLNTFFPYYSLTLQYEHQFKSKINGTVEEYALPEFINYNYSMRLSSDIVNMVGKIDLLQYKCLLPYFSVGIGAAFNRVSNYTEWALPTVFPARVEPGYNRKTSTNFAYSLGAGIDIITLPNVWITIGYEYLNLGKMNSGRGAGSWSSTHLNFGRLKTNTVLGSITYLI